MVSLQNFLQLDDYNGVPLAAGKIYVYHQGRTELAEIYSDINGETPIANPAVLDDLGMQEIYVSNVYNYTVVVTDPYNNELFTRDIYPNGVDGDGNNRLYEGIDPIVVNNDKMAISAKKATLSVQDPLYFVEDSPTAVCIGLQESAYSGLPYIENSAIELDPSGNISAISGYPFHSDSADNATSAESAGIVTDGWETGSDGRITAYNGTAFSAGKVYSGISPVYVDNENDQIGVSSKDFLANSPLYFTEYSDRVELSISGLPDTPGLMYESGFNYESGKITGYNGSGISAGKVYTGISPVTVDNDNDTISVASAILGVQAPLYFVEDSESATILGVDTSSWTIDIPQSADWQNATDIISSNSGNWDEAYSTVANNSGDWQSAADELAVLNTAKWDSTCDYVSSHSADWNNKLDADIYAADSGTFLTALPSDVVYTADIQDMATTGDINDLVTSIAETYQTKTDMTGYLTTGDSSNFYTTANESGFITGVDLTDYATKDFVNDNVASSISGKLDIATYSSESGNFLTAVPADYATTAWVTGQGYLTAETDWTNTITAASANAYNEATAQIPTDYATTAQLADKLDSSIYANDSGTFLTAHQSLPESADWNSAASTVSAGYANWDASYATLTSNSANWDNSYITLTANSAGWDRISELSGYSANGWSAKMTGTGPLILASTQNLTANGIPTTKGYLTVSSSPVSWCTITNGAIYMYNTSRSNSAQYIRPDTIVKWNNYDSGKLNVSVYSAASGTFLTAVPAGTMNESNFGYDASNNITAYNGSAFKAGDEFPQSATEAIEVVTGGSANWNSTTATVATNSGAWGGQGIELSAGFGIDIQLVDNKLVISLATATGDI